MKAPFEDPGYIRCIEKMVDAAMLWIGARGREGLSFTLPPANMMLIAELPLAVALLAPGAVAREFLLALDAATDGQATAFQACVLVREIGLPFIEQLPAGKAVPS